MEKSETDFAWAAGILDGEGCIGLYPEKRKGRELYCRLIVRVNNTSERMILKMQVLLGGSVRPIKVPVNAQAQWSWQVYGHNALQSLQSVLPYLICKRENAEILLRWGETLTDTRQKGWKHLSSEAKELRFLLLKEDQNIRRGGQNKKKLEVVA